MHKYASGNFVHFVQRYEMSQASLTFHCVTDKLKPSKAKALSLYDGVFFFFDQQRLAYSRFKKVFHLFTCLNGSDFSPLTRRKRSFVKDAAHFCFRRTGIRLKRPVRMDGNTSAPPWPPADGNTRGSRLSKPERTGIRFGFAQKLLQSAAPFTTGDAAAGASSFCFCTAASI